MSEPKFTPGPWRVAKEDTPIGPGPGRFIVCAISPSDRPAILITSHVESDGNEKADARAIAAVPVLVDAVSQADALLRQIEDYFLESKRRPRPWWFMQVQTTIAGTSSALAKVGGK